MDAARERGGEPALVLWGAPLEISRLFGLVNHLVALILAGVVGAWALLRRPPGALVAGCVAAGAIGGTAAVGANYVSVTFIASAAVVGVSVHRHGRLRTGALALAAAASVVALAAALALSRLGPASHGSSAVEQIRHRGLAAIGNLIESRVQENLDQLREQAVWFWGFTAALTVGLLVATARAFRRGTGPVPESRRHGFGGAVALAVAALVTLVAEDTGVLVAPVLAAFAAAVWLIERTGEAAGAT